MPYISSICVFPSGPLFRNFEPAIYLCVSNSTRRVELETHRIHKRKKSRKKEKNQPTTRRVLVLVRPVAHTYNERGNTPDDMADDEEPDIKRARLEGGRGGGGGGEDDAEEVDDDDDEEEEDITLAVEQLQDVQAELDKVRHVGST